MTSWISRQAVKFIVVASASLMLPATAFAADLLSPAKRAEIAATEDMRRGSPGLIAHRYFQLDSAVLGRVLGVGPKSRGIKTLDTRVTLSAKAGETATFERLYREVSPEGVVTWAGRQTGGKGGTVVLIVEGNSLTGQFQIGNRYYRLAPAGGGLVRVSEYDVSGFPEDIVKPVPSPRSDVDTGTEPDVGETTTTVIRVMPVYTNRARQAALTAGTTITAEATLAIALTNLGLANTGLNIRMVNAGTTAAPSTYDENRGTYEQSLNDISFGTRFAAIRRLRDSRRADLVALLREGGSYCGIAWLITNPSQATSNYGFSVTSRSCITGYTFGHELGHNIGLNHDRYVVSNKPAGSFNYGYVNFPARLRTIMAYNTYCFERGRDCARVNMFSTPLRRYQGKVVGTAGSDSARMLRVNAKKVAAYR
jgi:hypothetical protein